MLAPQGFAGWFETSAKDNLNINEAAQFLVQQIIENDRVRCSLFVCLVVVFRSYSTSRNSPPAGTHGGQRAEGHGRAQADGRGKAREGRLLRR
jgi:hypothetical protein